MRIDFDHFCRWLFRALVTVLKSIVDESFLQRLLRLDELSELIHLSHVSLLSGNLVPVPFAKDSGYFHSRLGVV